MPGLAVYATPENMAKFEVDENKPKSVDTFSSPYVQRVRINLSQWSFILFITLSSFFFKEIVIAMITDVKYDLAIGLHYELKW